MELTQIKLQNILNYTKMEVKNKELTAPFVLKFQGFLKPIFNAFSGSSPIRRQYRFPVFSLSGLGTRPEASRFDRRSRLQSGNSQNGIA
jgi:hypothetical protein